MREEKRVKGVKGEGEETTGALSASAILVTSSGITRADIMFLVT